MATEDQIKQAWGVHRSQAMRWFRDRPSFTVALPTPWTACLRDPIHPLTDIEQITFQHEIQRRPLDRCTAVRVRVGDVVVEEWFEKL